MHYELPATDPIDGSPVLVAVSADVLPPDIVKVSLARRSARRRFTLTLEVEVNRDSVQHVDSDRTVVGVTVVVIGMDCSSQRENIGFVFSRYDPPRRTFTVTVPWSKSRPATLVELQFLTNDTRVPLTNDAGFEIEP